MSGALIFSALTLAAPAAAQHPPAGRLFGTQGEPPPIPSGPARLEYTAPEGCPDESELRSGAASRMGSDPFVSAGAPAALLVRTRITRQGAGYAAAVELRDSAGHVLWTRPPLGDADCSRLVRIIATITIPTLLEPPLQAPAPPPLPPPPAPPPPPVAPPPDAKAPPAGRPAFRLGARAALVVGAGPAVTASLAAAVGAGWEHFSIHLEGRADLPATGTVEAGVRLRTSILAGSIVPCGHYGWFVGCGIVTIGVLRDEGVNLDVPAHDSAAYLAAGVRAALEWPIVPAFALVLSGDALVNLHPIAAQADVMGGRREIWRSGPFAGLVGGGVVARFGGP
jgi:hypothetical protein